MRYINHNYYIIIINNIIKQNKAHKQTYFMLQKKSYCVNTKMESKWGELSDHQPKEKEWAQIHEKQFKMFNWDSIKKLLFKQIS